MPVYRPFGRERGSSPARGPGSRTRVSLSMQSRMLRPRKPSAYLNDTNQLGKQWVIAVRLIESLVAVRPTGDETDDIEFMKLILNGRERESAHCH